MKNCCALFLTLLCGAFSIFAQSKAVAFVGVNVIPMDKERILMNQTVLVRDGIIIEIGKKVKIPKYAQIVDGKGKYLIPGLVDMHAHLLSDEALPDSLAPDELKIMLANGVTTIRLMIGTPEHLILRQKSANQEIIAPTIYAASPQFSGRAFGDIFNGYVVTNEEQARAAVRKAKQAGYDFIKLTFFISRAVYDAVIDEAVKQNIRVIGHVDRQVGLLRAFEAKQQIEHLDGYFEAMVPTGANLAGSTSGVYVWQPKAWESLDVLDEKRIPELARKTVEANPFACPTLTFLKSSFGIGSTDAEVQARAGYRFYPPKIREELDEPRHIFWKNPPSAPRRAKYVDYRNKITKAIWEAGGKILAGSDSPDWLLLYGFTLHTEMKNLTAAGLSNYAALEAATKNPALFFGTIGQTGTIEKGKKADLVLLDANPLENISNTEKRSGVMLKGKYYAQTELNRWLDEIAAKFQKVSDSEKVQGNAADGFWEGAIEKDGKFWRTNLNIVRSGENFKAFADFVDVDAYGLEFSVKQTGETLRIERPQPNGKAIIFEGKIEGDDFKGNWSGTNTNAVFTLKRGKLPPKFFREEEVSFKNSDVTLSGTLILPLSARTFPTVVFTHGSGAQSRAPSRSEALRFVKNGIAALVYDKRGTGKSTGDFRTASMEDLARDALAGVEFLKTRNEIDKQKIGVAGHSQGGWIAPLAATMSKTVAFVIASAASGVSPDRQSIYHRANVMREMGFSETDVKIATELREKLYASGRLLLEKNPNAAAERKKVSAELAKYAKEPWFEAGAELPPNLDDDKPSQGALELLFFEPEPMWEKVKVPVLLIWGDKDTVVPVTEGKTIIENALKKGGNQHFTTKIFPNVNHGVVVVRNDKTWDFPRVDLNYFDAMVEWTVSKTKS